MNLIECYILKIHSERKCDEVDFPLYELVVDCDEYGRKSYNKKIHVNESDYKSIKEKNYYLT